MVFRELLSDHDQCYKQKQDKNILAKTSIRK